MRKLNIDEAVNYRIDQNDFWELDGNKFMSEASIANFEVRVRGFGKSKREAKVEAATKIILKIARIPLV